MPSREELNGGPGWYEVIHPSRATTHIAYVYEDGSNRAENIAWGSRSQNMYDAVRHGTHAWSRKTHCPKNHPYSGENLISRPCGSRGCRACMRAANRAYRLRKKARNG